jgi:GPI mannosyltransferase 3
VDADHSGRWNQIYGLMLAGLGIRISFALFSDNIYHPDELFQYLEQAHRLVVWYGYVPWEYRFGIRSWITPGFIAMWLFLCKALHLDSPNIVTVQGGTGTNRHKINHLPQS